MFEERPAQYGTLNRPLSQDLTKALEEARGVNCFYTHQADAINAFWNGKHVVASTSTASGKSIIYQVPHSSGSPGGGCLCLCSISKVPVLTALEDDKDSTAIFIYPTKVYVVELDADFPIHTGWNIYVSFYLGPRSGPKDFSSAASCSMRLFTAVAS